MSQQTLEDEDDQPDGNCSVFESVNFQLAAQGPAAAQVIVELMQSPTVDPQVRLQAAEFVLSMFCGEII